MDTETMRWILAELMGWKRREAYWVDEHGAIECHADWWTPDTDWPQCGLVIEAMRRDGWEWRLRDNPDDTIYAEVRRYNADESSAEGWAEGGDERHARMLAAYRALEGHR